MNTKYFVEPGDRVIIASEQKPILFGLFIVFILPLLLPVVVYLLTVNSGFGGWFAGFSAFAAIALIWGLSKSRWFLEQTKPRIKRVISEKR